MVSEGPSGSAICPLVSVMVITYNQKDYIRETIESVIGQDYPNIEYVVADDGSTDGTAEIIQSYAENHPDIVVAITGEENVGITKNSNRGLRMCRGDFIALQGGDDVFLPGKITRQVQWLLEDQNRVICGHNLYYCDDKTRITGKYAIQKVSGKGPKAWIEKGALYGATSLMIRRDAIPESGFDERLPLVSDWKLCIDCLHPEGEFGFLSDYLGLYRKHGSNITNVKAPVMRDAEMTLRLVEEEYPQYALSVKIGRGFVLNYGYGYQSIERGEYLDSMKYFIQAILVWPFNWKPYIRLGQSLFLWVKCRKF